MRALTAIISPARCAEKGGAFALIAAVAILASCASGQRSDGFVNTFLSDSYIPLYRSEYIIFERQGAATVVAPYIAVTNAHNSGLVETGDILAQSRDYDLLFFRTGTPLAPPMAEPELGQYVIAYGQGSGGELREARGTIQMRNRPVAPRCDDCPVQLAVAFDANGGPGFSGGPVVDANTGAVLGIVFGYNEGTDGSGLRTMYAYDMTLVMAEMNRLLAQNRR